MRRAMAIVGCAGGLALAAPAAGADGGGPFSAYQGGYGASAPGGKSVQHVARLRRHARGALPSPERRGP